MEKKQVFVMLGVVIAITLGITLYCLFFGNQYIVIFDSKGGTEVEKQIVKTGTRVEEPVDPVREGYEFVEWQLNDEKYDFSKKVRKNMTLKAQWRKISSVSEILYKVVFDSDGGSSVNTQEVSPGTSVKKPTDPVKDGYIFEGWYFGDSKFDFSKKITQDMTLKAKWKEKKSDTKKPDKTDDKKPNEDKKPTKPDENKKPSTDSSLSADLKVGDRVKIVGEYAESSTSKRALHKRAVGWKRVVLKIYEGREYPYRVGNETGTTGFFKAESLEKIDE